MLAQTTPSQANRRCIPVRGSRQDGPQLALALEWEGMIA